MENIGRKRDIYTSWDNVPEITKKQLKFIYNIKLLDHLRKKQDVKFANRLLFVAIAILFFTVLYLRFYISGFSFAKLAFIGPPIIIGAILFALYCHLRDFDNKRKALINYVNKRAMSLEGYHNIIESFDEGNKSQAVLSLMDNHDIFFEEIQKEENEIYQKSLRQ